MTQQSLFSQKVVKSQLKPRFQFQRSCILYCTFWWSPHLTDAGFQSHLFSILRSFYVLQVCRNAGYVEMFINTAEGGRKKGKKFPRTKVKKSLITNMVVCGPMPKQQRISVLTIAPNSQRLEFLTQIQNKRLVVGPVKGQELELKFMHKARTKKAAPAIAHLLQILLAKFSLIRYLNRQVPHNKWKFKNLCHTQLQNPNFRLFSQQRTPKWRC